MITTHNVYKITIAPRSLDKQHGNKLSQPRLLRLQGEIDLTLALIGAYRLAWKTLRRRLLLVEIRRMKMKEKRGVLEIMREISF